MPIEQVLFRASGAGALMTNKQGAVFTDVQKARISELLQEKLTGLNANGNKVKFEGTKKPEELAELIAKRDAPPELSDTAKAFVRKVWLKNEKGIVKDIKSKYLDKGTFNEEDAITLISDVDGIKYFKNDERFRNEDHEGECDVVEQLSDKKLIIDVKCSWDAETFMASKPSIDYEWQGRIYMELWDADEFQLRYCLVDCPAHLLQKEKEFAWRKYYADTMTVEEEAELDVMMQPIRDQIDRNMIYSIGDRFTKEERVKTFTFYRDKEKMKLMAERVKMARDYYKTITLNGSN